MALLTRLAAAAGPPPCSPPRPSRRPARPFSTGSSQWGDVVADINVVSQNSAQSASAAATAAGNAASGANITGGLDARSEQTMSGAALANAALNSGNIGEAAIVASAQGNTLQAQTEDGDLELVASQTSDGGDVLAHARANVANVQTLAVGIRPPPPTTPQPPPITAISMST